MSTANADPCEICGGAEIEPLHRQEFLLPGDVQAHYDVSFCRRCGFAFAQNLPSQAEYDAYYAANTRYTYEGSRNVSPSLKKVHGDNFAFVDRFLAGRKGRVLDVGCSTGLLLSFFHQAGYDVRGIDPAPECRAIAERLYGVEVDTCPISSFRPDRPFDVVLLSSVLEHLRRPLEGMCRIAPWIGEGGHVFVQVPDAEHFGVDMKEPFLEFSVEHVQYFTLTTLTRLMAKAGFALAEARHDVLLQNGTSYPAVTAMFEKRPTGASGFNYVDPAPLRDYIRRSREKLAAVERSIDALVETREPVVVWGVGSLTARLMATTNMSRMNIQGFVDSASGLHGKRLHDREIRAPAWLRGKDHTVLVSSYVWADSIRDTLERELAYGGRIVTF